MSFSERILEKIINEYIFGKQDEYGKVIGFSEKSKMIFDNIFLSLKDELIEKNKNLYLKEFEEMSFSSDIKRAIKEKLFEYFNDKSLYSVRAEITEQIEETLKKTLDDIIKSKIDKKIDIYVSEKLDSYIKQKFYSVDSFWERILKKARK